MWSLHIACMLVFLLSSNGAQAQGPMRTRVHASQLAACLVSKLNAVLKAQSPRPLVAVHRFVNHRDEVTQSGHDVAAALHAELVNRDDERSFLLSSWDERPVSAELAQEGNTMDLGVAADYVIYGKYELQGSQLGTVTAMAAEVKGGARGRDVAFCISQAEPPPVEPRAAASRPALATGVDWPRSGQPASPPPAVPPGIASESAQSRARGWGPWHWTATGAAAVGVVAAGFFVVNLLKAQDRLEACPNHACATEALAADYRAPRTRALVAGTVGAAAVVAGTVALVLAVREAEPEGNVTAGVGLGSLYFRGSL